MDDEISEPPHDPYDGMDEDNDDGEAGPKRGRGAPKIPDQWTRVVSMSTDNLQDLKVYPISTDLLLNQGYEKGRKRRGEPDWEIHFHPQDMIEKHPEPNLDQWQLKEDRLRNYAIQLTNIRKWIVERARAADPVKIQQVNEHVALISKLAKKLQTREYQR